nr:MAG TPA: Major capsid protein [Caudoviricetes sp.]
MREFLTSGQVGQIELNEQKRIRKQINDRWDALGMTEGLKGVVKENIATLYENEAKALLSEATASDNSGSFETVVFPIIRRVFSKLLANDIVSVQAMNLPIGKLFFMLPVTSEREWSKADGTPADGNGLEDGMYGRHKGLMGYERTDRRNGNKYNRYYLPDEAVNGMAFEYTLNGGKDWTKTTAITYDTAVAEAEAEAKKTGANAIVRQISPSITSYHKRTLYDLFYNDFLYDNSKGKIHIKLGTATPMVFDNYELVNADEANHKIKVYADGSIRSCILKVSGFSSFNAGKLTGPDGNEMDTEAFLASLKVYAKNEITGDGFACFDVNEGIPFRVVTQRYGKGMVEYADACDAEGCIYLDVDLAKPCKKQGETLDGYKGIDGTTNNLVTGDFFGVAWSQYDSLELETEIGEVSFKLDSVTVSVEERKLRATWSPELAQDVSAFHNIDAEAELTALLSEQIAAEIDREILRDLRKFAPWQARWDVNGWRRQAGFSTNYTQKDWNQELMTKINQISAQIHKATLRGGANFIVVSSEGSAVFDNLEYFHVTDAQSEADQYNMGIERIGAINNRYQVYRDPYSPAWSIIIGHKGKSLLDTGYIYAPYIPMQLTPTIYNPENFAPVKGIMTRYAKKCVNNRFYGAIKIDGLVQWDPQELR